MQAGRQVIVFALYDLFEKIHGLYDEPFVQLPWKTTHTERESVCVCVCEREREREKREQRERAERERE